MIRSVNYKVNESMTYGGQPRSQAIVKGWRRSAQGAEISGARPEMQRFLGGALERKDLGGQPPKTREYFVIGIPNLGQSPRWRGGSGGVT